MVISMMQWLEHHVGLGAVLGLLRRCDWRLERDRGDRDRRQISLFFNPLQSTLLQTTIIETKATFQLPEGFNED
jgi:hypothetical protein